MSLYQLYRPQYFSDLYGQDDQAKILQAQLSVGKFSHAYLFTGPRGVGKTTTARILAKYLNCENPKDGEPCGKCESCVAVTDGRHLDVFEIDAASNRGIEEIRDLREKIKLSPTSGKYKVYIIDEVHMLTTEAFNALLKTLEEPPKHAVFVLCTTESHKVPATIISRTQRFHFERAGAVDLAKLLQKVAKKEALNLPKDAAVSIAEAADGSYRDSLTILEQVSAMDEITAEKVHRATRRSNKVRELFKLIESENAVDSIRLVNDQYQAGINLSSLTADLVGIMRDELLKAVEEGNDVRQIKLVQLLKLFSQAHLLQKNAITPTLPLELAIVEGVGTKERIVKEVLEEVKAEEEAEIEVKEVREVQSADLEGLKGSWESILKSIKPLNHSLEAFLRGCDPNEVGEKHVTLKFFYKFHKDMVDQPKNRALLEQEISRVLGRELRVKTILGDKSQAKKVKVAEVKNVEEVSGDDLIQRAVDIFNTGIS